MLYRWFCMPGDKTLYGRITQNDVERLDAAAVRGLNVKACPDDFLEYLRSQPSRFGRYFKPLCMMVLPAQSGMLCRAAKTQANVLLSRTGLALERYRMARGAYPETLDALAPEFLPALFPDPVTVRPFLYQREDPGKFALWSVGWNETDEGGKAEKSMTKGDWVWGR